jgi:hypothetical protein
MGYDYENPLWGGQSGQGLRLFDLEGDWVVHVSTFYARQNYFISVLQ